MLRAYFSHARIHCVFKIVGGNGSPDGSTKEKEFDEEKKDCAASLFGTFSTYYRMYRGWRVV